MKRVRPILVAVIAVIGVAIIATVAAQDSNTANVEVRVWQSTSDAESLYISARPEGGSWRTLGTIPLDMSGVNSRGTFRYGDITVAVPVGGSTTRSIDDTRGCNAALEYEDDFPELRFLTCHTTPAALGERVVGVLTWNGVESDFEGWLYEGMHVSWIGRAAATERVCLAFSNWVTENYTISRVLSCSVDGILNNYGIPPSVFEEPQWTLRWITAGTVLSNNGNQYSFDARVLYNSTVLSVTFYRQEEVLTYHAD